MTIIFYSGLPFLIFSKRKYLSDLIIVSLSILFPPFCLFPSLNSNEKYHFFSSSSLHVLLYHFYKMKIIQYSRTTISNYSLPNQVLILNFLVQVVPLQAKSVLGVHGRVGG